MKRSEKQQGIINELRRRIVRGTYPPGSRIPPRTAIEREFAASTVTVQKALARLIHEEFLVACNQHGTFVAEHPPHLSNYALLLAHHHGDRWSQFVCALCDGFATLQQTRGLRILTYFGFPRPSDIDKYNELLSLAASQRLAGMIFAFLPSLVAGTPLLDDPSMPKAAILTQRMGCPIPAVCIDYHSFFNSALDYLKEQGRRKIALISIHDTLEYLGYDIAAGLSERGMEMRPCWWQRLDMDQAEAARERVHLLMHAGRSERPDGLIISDDNHVEAATAGLVDAGVRVPDDLTVVAHANFPLPTRSYVKAKRLGFDCVRLIHLAVDSIDAQRRGLPHPQFISVPATSKE